jgi:phosphoribosylaminoimidazole-succinocarboxamide synthase
LFFKRRKEEAMGAIIPKQVAETDLSRRLADAGLRRIHQGKVRDTYEIPNYPGLLLVVATDRLSIFDIVLPGRVLDKGKVLTALTVFWLEEVFSGVCHHLKVYGRNIDLFLPLSLRGDQELMARALIVEKLNIYPVECVARGYLTGSGWRSYRETGVVCGHQLPSGLYDGSVLPEPIFTPATKAQEGHDEPLTAEEVAKEYGTRLEIMTLWIYSTALNYALKRGIILADTKFEWGSSSRDSCVLGDEVLTPDSSRFWDKEEWREAAGRRRSPKGFDKEPVRQWGMTVSTPFGKGINQLEPNNSRHLAFIEQDLKIPQSVLHETTERYLEIFERLTGKSLPTFHKEIMGIG